MVEIADDAACQGLRFSVEEARAQLAVPRYPAVSPVVLV